MYNFAKIMQTNYLPALNRALTDKLLRVQRTEERPDFRGARLFIAVFNIKPTAEYLESDNSGTYYAIIYNPGMLVRPKYCPKILLLQCLETTSTVGGGRPSSQI
jgi:hypothetical protein